MTPTVLNTPTVLALTVASLLLGACLTCLAVHRRPPPDASADTPSQPFLKALFLGLGSLKDPVSHQAYRIGVLTTALAAHVFVACTTAFPNTYPALIATHLVLALALALATGALTLMLLVLKAFFSDTA